MNNINLMEKIILNHGIVDNKYFRIIDEVTEYLNEDSPSIRKFYVIKIQIKTFILGFSKYITIKSWTCDYYDTKEKEFIKSEANELFNKIVNPYLA